MQKTFDSKYFVQWYFNGYIIVKEKPGYTRHFYLKSIYKNNCVWYTDPVWGKTYKTEKAAYKVINKIISEGK